MNTTSRLVRLVYKLLYKPCALSMGEGDFRSPAAPRPLDRFSWNLKYITTSRTRPRTQNFRCLRRRWWSGQIASLTHESLSFFVPVLFIASSRLHMAYPGFYNGGGSRGGSRARRYGGRKSPLRSRAFQGQSLGMGPGDEVPEAKAKCEISVQFITFSCIKFWI